ncbi:MAG: CPXCG motif-containing cysteine-rich protein [Candidatus Omnitrophica bacterium]|nr:CPXCG motif-containing cysteine-rich protein [Candidatus Omnitrophota bacterium]
MEEDYPFPCPHCGVDLSTRLDKSGGSKQKFVQDCEVCCRPIQIEVWFKGDEVIYFSAEVGE